MPLVQIFKCAYIVKKQMADLIGYRLGKAIWERDALNEGVPFQLYSLDFYPYLSPSLGGNRVLHNLQ